MTHVPLEDLLDKTEQSVYKLVITASRRSLELAEGRPKLIEVDSGLKTSTIALFEIASGKVTCRSIKK
jgi:DNA-directed RNA polymerase omega subunit